MKLLTANTVVMIRHAQSQWNRENRFTGWADPPLTDAGVNEAVRAGELLRAAGYQFDTAFSSRLQRAGITLDILLQVVGQTGIDRHQDWRLNERHYGALQGRHKSDVIKQYGEEQVWRWRRGYHDAPTAMLRSDPNHPLQSPLFADIDPARLPDVESLAETRGRVMAFWQEQAMPRIRQGRRLLISAHGNTLRALIMDLAEIGEDEVESFEIPTATPIVYEFDEQGRPVHWRYLESA
jgi:2,3-bisphosphoglycerate-dependent phosphoglycerate mutase